MSVNWGEYLAETLRDYYASPTTAAHRRWSKAFVQCSKSLGSEAACAVAREAYNEASTPSSADPGGATARAADVVENSVPASSPR